MLLHALHVLALLFVISGKEVIARSKLGLSLVKENDSFLSVNCSGLPFESALQATVAQGLLNRAYGSHVYLHGLATGLGDEGQKDGAGYPGAKFIEWMEGRAGGPWYEPKSTSATCTGLDKRWLETAAEAAGKTPVATTFDQLIAAVDPLLRGRVQYTMTEMHALGPVVTMAGVDAVLPITDKYNPLPHLPLRWDSRGKFGNATAATQYTTAKLLARTNKTVLAVQAPTCLPFLADAIVDYKMAMFWMPDMCSTATPEARAQHAAMEAMIEQSGHFTNATGKGLYCERAHIFLKRAAPAKPVHSSPAVVCAADPDAIVADVGWYNNTHEPNPELLEECTVRHSLLTLASDQSPNLSFLSKLPPITTADKLSQPPMWGGGQTRIFSETKAYITLVISDGDNIAEDWTELRPLLEQRVLLKSTVPVSWTISNRWVTWGAPVLRWAFAQATKTGVDSFLMGPSGYGYSFPGNMTTAAAKSWLAGATIEAADLLGMEGYVHWDVDLFLNNKTTSHTIDFIQRFNGTAIKGVFMLGSDPLMDDGKWPIPPEDKTKSVFIGDVVAFPPVYQYGPPNATSAAAALNAVNPGELVYCYLGLGDDMRLIDQIAALKSEHVELVGYRELIDLARQREVYRLSTSEF